MDEPRSNRQRAAIAHWERMRQLKKADAANAEKQAKADLAAYAARRAKRRDNQPLLAGGLFDECRRGEQDLWS